LTEEDMINFIKIEFGRIGADSNITPREVIRDFIELLNIIYQNPEINVTELLGSESFKFAKSQTEESENTEEEFAEFEI
ncbi:MAG: BREX system ATP-binding domain-containing protein, partial [Oscillospiraceae bacterium]